jgi:hypothetical protein
MQQVDLLAGHKALEVRYSILIPCSALNLFWYFICVAAYLKNTVYYGYVDGSMKCVETLPSDPKN